MRLGIDIGGTKTDAVAIDERRPADPAHPARHRVRVAAVVETAVSGRRADRRADRPERRAASSRSASASRGWSTAASGHVAHAVNLGLDGLDLGGELAGRLGVGVRVENDVKAAALGAYHLLGLDRHDGVPQPRHRARRRHRRRRPTVARVPGIAGEIGHIPVDPNGALCACGQRGCLETVASGSGVARQWPTDDPLPVRSLFAAAADGDPDAQAIKARLAAGIASAVRVLVLTVDVDDRRDRGRPQPPRGAAAPRCPRGARRLGRTSPFLASLELPGRVRLVPEGTPVAAVGAALVGGN